MRDHSHTLPQVLDNYRRRAIARGGSEMTYAIQVREHYERTVPQHARSVEFSTHPDAYRQMHRDAEKISRWFSEDVAARLPAEIIESCIAALPEDLRQSCRAELAARQGLLAVERPQATPADDALNIGRIGKETGEVIIRASGMMADGKIDTLDAGSAETLILEIDEAMAVLAQMRARIETIR